MDGCRPFGARAVRITANPGLTPLGCTSFGPSGLGRSLKMVSKREANVPNGPKLKLVPFVREINRPEGPKKCNQTFTYMGYGLRKWAKIFAPLRARKSLPHGLLQILQVRLLPVFRELLEADIRQRMMEHHLQHFERHGSDVSSGERGVDHMHGMPQRCGQHLRCISVILVD